MQAENAISESLYMQKFGKFSPLINDDKISINTLIVKMTYNTMLTIC